MGAASSTVSTNDRDKILTLKSVWTKTLQALGGAEPCYKVVVEVEDSTGTRSMRACTLDDELSVAVDGRTGSW